MKKLRPTEYDAAQDPPFALLMRHEERRKPFLLY